MKKYILITSFIFVLVLGGAFMFASNKADAVVTNPPPVNLGVRYAFAAWTGITSTGVLYKLNAYDASKNFLTSKQTTATTLDLSDIAGVAYYDISACNTIGCSVKSSVYPVSYRDVASTAKTTVATTTPIKVGYDFAPTISQGALLAKVNTANIKVKSLLAIAQAKNISYVAAYNSADKALKNFKTSKTTTNTNLAVTAFRNYFTKEIAVKNAVKDLNVALNNLNVVIAALTKGSVSSDGGYVVVGANSITINSGMDSQVFPSVKSPLICLPQCPNSVVGTVTISGDNIIVDTGSGATTNSGTTNPVFLPSDFTACSSLYDTAGEVAVCIAYRATHANV